MHCGEALEAIDSLDNSEEDRNKDLQTTLRELSKFHGRLSSAGAPVSETEVAATVEQWIRRPALPRLTALITRRVPSMSVRKL